MGLYSNETFDEGGLKVDSGLLGFSVFQMKEYMGRSTVDPRNSRLLYATATLLGPSVVFVARIKSVRKA